MYNETISNKIIKVITPTKWGMFKFFCKVGILGVASTYYFSAINNQMNKDESNTFLSSVEDVLKNQYDYIKDPFLNLLKRAEGYQSTFYADNKGYAVGYGYNPTQNSKEYNKNILDFAGVDDKTKSIILKNAEKYRDKNSEKIPEEFKKVNFTKQQLDKMALYAQESYENSFFRVLNHKLEKKHIEGSRRIKILQAYVDLPENKKAVLIHMTYKVGENNLEKYNNFFNNLINYLEKPNSVNKEAVANSFTYKYTKNGVVLHDTRVEKLHHDLFLKDIPTKTESIEKNKSKAENKNLTEEEKFKKAMKEVNDQITVGGALELLFKTANKMNKTMTKSNAEVNQSNPNVIDNQNEYDDTEQENQDQYYESSADEQQIIVNGQEITIQNDQSVQIINDGNKVIVKIR